MAFGLILMVSCKDDDAKLFGKWQMNEVNIGGTVSRVDTVFYNFQHSMFMYQIMKNEHVQSFQYGYNTVLQNDSLKIELINDPRNVKDFLPLTDWKSAVRTFKMEELSKNKLILSVNDTTYIFRRF